MHTIKILKLTFRITAVLNNYCDFIVMNNLSENFIPFPIIKVLDFFAANGVEQEF